MTPLEIIRQAQADMLIDDDGHVVTLELLPGLSQTELRDFARQVPCSIPPEITELLRACRGFYGAIEQVEFTGRDLMFEFEPAFPSGLPIAADGYGNLWVVDLHPHTAKWGPIYFVCHDAPVILYQADTGDGGDVIEGLLGGDELYGDFAADKLHGSPNDNFLQGGRGPDRMFGGANKDYIDGVDRIAGNDELDGGWGTDYCVGDEGDTFKDCDGNVVEVPVPSEL